MSVPNTRHLCIEVLGSILSDGVFLDQALHQHVRDKAQIALVKRIVRTTLKRRGQLEAILQPHLTRPLPKKAAYAAHALLVGAAELVFLEQAAHGVVGSLVTLVKRDPRSRHMAGLVNAVLRKVAQHPRQQDDVQTGRINTPAWLAERLDVDYGAEHADAIMSAHLSTPPVDLSLKHPQDTLEGIRLTPQTLRLAPDISFSQLTGFAKGDFWVQDVAAALPVQMLGDVHGQRCLDIAAAPGGKTMQLCARGAQVTALDISESRLKMLHENLKRTQLQAKVLQADALMWTPEQPFDCIVLDAPCSATGTLRRHPDLAYLSDGAAFSEKLAALVDLQRSLLIRAWSWIKPGGKLVYAACSLLRAEGEAQADWFLTQTPEACVTIPSDVPFLTPQGYLRTTPADWPEHGNLDGFFAVCLQKTA